MYNFQDYRVELAFYSHVSLRGEVLGHKTSLTLFIDYQARTVSGQECVLGISILLIPKIWMFDFGTVPIAW